MDSARSVEEEVARGEQAARILSEPLIQEALTTIRSLCLQEWENAPTRDVEGRERLWLMFKLSKQFEDHLRSVMETGRIAAKQIAEREKPFGIFKR